MPRGGARPGAGRKPKPKLGVAAPEVMVLPALTVDGEKTPDAPGSWPFGTRLEAEPLSDETPLAVMLRVMRTSEDERTQLMAAQLAAPYVHAKVAPAGKKESKADAAKGVSGRFATTAAPRLVSSR